MSAETMSPIPQGNSGTPVENGVIVPSALIVKVVEPTWPFEVLPLTMVSVTDVSPPFGNVVTVIVKVPVPVPMNSTVHVPVTGEVMVIVFVVKS